MRETAAKQHALGSWRVFWPVVIIADLIAAGLQSGWRVLRRPTMPETWGHDIEVPDTELNRTLRLSKSWLVGPCASVYAAITLTPGAVISGCSMRENNELPEWFNREQSEKRMVSCLENLKDLWCNGVRSLWWKSCHEGCWLSAQLSCWRCNISNGRPG